MAGTVGTPRSGSWRCARVLWMRQDLQKALRAQALEVMAELITWKSGAFSFVERSPEAAGALSAHALDAVELLLETAGRLHAWENAVPAHAVFEKSGDPTKVALPTGELGGARLRRRQAQRPLDSRGARPARKTGVPHPVRVGIEGRDSARAARSRDARGAVRVALFRAPAARALDVAARAARGPPGRRPGGGLWKRCAERTPGPSS